MTHCRGSQIASAPVRPQADKFAGGHRIRVTPVPIPNTEVKPDTADGTVWETVWESRSLPALIGEARVRNHPGLFLCTTFFSHDVLLAGSVQLQPDLNA